MKYIRKAVEDMEKRSPSARREWIEIASACSCSSASRESPSARREWIEIVIPRDRRFRVESPSARREWIEIWSGTDNGAAARPSPSARREWIEIYPLPRPRRTLPVSLREEGVD